MHRKRFKHQAFTLCHMFCGWKLHSALPVMEAHGRGTLKIDALTGGCWINGTPIETLTVAQELRLWLCEDASTHSIDLEAVDEATLEVDFEVGTDAHYYTTSLRCRSQIRSGEDLYASEYTNSIG